MAGAKGLRMGMMDLEQRRAVIPMQSHEGPALSGNMASTSSLSDVHDYSYQTPGGVMDSYNAYLTRQHQPMQMIPLDRVQKRPSSSSQRRKGLGQPQFLDKLQGLPMTFLIA